MAKTIDPKAKAKKQKIYAGIGGVILLGLLAFQVPRTLKMLHPADTSSSSPPPAASTTPTTTPTTAPTAAPSLSGGNATSAGPTGKDGLVDADAVPPPQSGQLLAFGLFRSKDPFVQQLDLENAASAASGTTGLTGATGPAGATGGSGLLSGGRSNPVLVTPSKATTAEISVNGVAQTVKVGGRFPSSNPFFELLSLTAKSAKISIAGGTLATGAPSVTLTKTRPLTLENTADGARYVLRLLSVS